MYLERFMPSFQDELTKISHELEQSERTDFAQPKKEEEGHKGKYPIPDKKHYGIALGFAKMHHDEGALKAIHAKGKEMGYAKEAAFGAVRAGRLVGSLAGSAALAGTGYALGRRAGRRQAQQQQPMLKQSGGFGAPNIADSDEMAKMGGLFKNTVLGLGMLGATAGGAKAVKTIAKPAAQMAKAPRMVGAASSQMADLAREGIKF